MLVLSLKIRKPRPQRERAQWDIGIAHAEKALKMSREERIEQYTFIYVDQEPEEALAKAKKTAASKSEAKKNRRPKPAPSTQPEHGSAGTGTGTATGSSPSHAEARRQGQRRQPSGDEEEAPPVKIAWKTAAARKSLPASITMHNLDLQKCNMSPVVKIEQVFALQNAAGDGKLIDQFVYSTKVRAFLLLSYPEPALLGSLSCVHKAFTMRDYQTDVTIEFSSALSLTSSAALAVTLLLVAEQLPTDGHVFVHNTLKILKLFNFSFLVEIIPKFLIKSVVLWQTDDKTVTNVLKSILCNRLLN